MNISATDLNLLVAFEALLEEHSVSRAAARVGLSQPAMSSALNRLRGLFADQLFVRTGRGVEPTPRALELAGPVRAGLEHLRRAIEGEAAFDPACSERTFRLAMTDYAEWLLLGPLMRQLDRHAERIQLQVRRLDRLFQPPEAELRAGSIDLAIGFFGDARTMQEGSLAETLFEEENVVIARRGRKGAMTLDAFTAARHAAIIYRPEPWGVIDQELAALGRRRRLCLAVPHFQTVIDAVAASNLIACVPRRLAQYFHGVLGLKVAPVPFPMPPFHTRMVWHRHTGDDPAMRWLLSELRQAARLQTGSPS
jgi:DNA-binding transcriptional LysR family regulator